MCCVEVVDANSACTLTRGPGVEFVKQGATLDDDGLGEVAIEVPGVDLNGLLFLLTVFILLPAAELSAECTLLS